MARRHRIAAKVTRSALKAGRVSLHVATAPLVLAGWGLVLGVVYWNMLTMSHRKRREERDRKRRGR